MTVRQSVFEKVWRFGLALTISSYMSSTTLFAGGPVMRCPCPQPCYQTDCPPATSQDSDSIQSTDPEFQPAPNTFQPTPTSNVAAAGPAAEGFLHISGDSPISACGMLSFGELNGTIGHPNFGCGRFNVAENGSPMIMDRFFVTYRHFEDATSTDVFSSPGNDNSATLDVDRVLFGFERTMFDGGMSFELRVPFNYQLSPEFNIRQDRLDPFPAPAQLTGVPIDDQTFELGNIDLAFKFLLHEDCCWTWTGGFGLSLPTGRDVTIQGAINDSDYVFFDGVNTVILPVDVQISAMIANETVYMVPFIGAAYRPTRRVFSQGFLQLDVPLNRTRGVLGIAGNAQNTPGSIGPIDIAAAEFAELTWQTLLRANLQLGYWFYDNPQNRGTRRIHKAAAFIEGHYTTTLNDADTLSWTAATIPNINDITLDLGNPANRVDIVNMTLGGAALVGKSEITSAFIVPLTSGDNKPFDWEYALMFNRYF